METPAVLSNDSGQKPPAQALYVKLNSKMVEALAHGRSKLSLIIGQDVTLQIDGQLYKSTMMPEVSQVDIYRGKKSKYHELARLSHRVHVQNIAVPTSITSAERFTILHVLAIESADAAHIARRSSIDVKKVEAVLQQLGIDSSCGNYNLPRPYYSRIDSNWSGYTQQERLSVRLATKAWLTNIQKTPVGNKRPLTPTGTTTSSSNGTNSTIPIKRPADSISSSGSVSSISGANGTITNNNDNNGADILEMAKKFKQHYPEYAKLYSAVTISSDKDQVQRLVTLHKKLAFWKQKLWEHGSTASKSAKTLTKTTKIKQTM